MKDSKGVKICEGQTVVVYWEDGESEGGAGVGNAWSDSGSYECEVAKDTGHLVFIRKDSGVKCIAADFRDEVLVVKDW